MIRRSFMPVINHCKICHHQPLKSELKSNPIRAIPHATWPGRVSDSLTLRKRLNHQHEIPAARRCTGAVGLRCRCVAGALSNSQSSSRGKCPYRPEVTPRINKIRTYETCCRYRGDNFFAKLDTSNFCLFI